MEKLSRVKKYEDLRQSIDTENTVNEPIRDSLEIEQKSALETFDSSILKKVEIKKEDSYIPEREKSDEHIQERNVVDDTFTNEYLDDFIREVRDYNIRKGTRESDDTQVDILSQLNSKNRAKRAHYVERIDDGDSYKDVLSKDAIADEVKKLLLDEEEMPVEVIPSTLDNDVYATTEMIIEQEDIAEKEEVVDYIVEEPLQPEVKPVTKAKKVLTPVYEMDGVDMYDTMEQSNTLPKDNQMHKRLVEETQQLRVQMDEYEDELTDLSDGVEKNNKLLNFILCFLILVLLVIIGFIGYYIWKGGGF